MTNVNIEQCHRLTRQTGRTVLLKVFFGSILSKYFSEILQFARVCVALPRELLGAAAACPVQLRKEATLAGSAP